MQGVGAVMALPLSAIAKALNVTYVVDGSIRRSGQTLRIAARLVRADNGYIVWSQVHDRRSSDLLEIQDDIANHIARAIQETTSAPTQGHRAAAERPAALT